MPDLFLDNEYLIRRQVFTILGAKFQVFNAQGEQVLFSKQKAFKLKEDIRIYADETLQDEKILIQARQVIDFSAAYDVVDSVEGRKVGALRRRGFRSILRDSWEMLDNTDRPIAAIQEDSMALALVRRFAFNLIPQSFHASTNGRTLVTYKQHFNPFVFKLRVRLEDGAREHLDPRLVLAGGVLLAAIEGRQRG
jgi:hypothetical protein